LPHIAIYYFRDADALILRHALFSLPYADIFSSFRLPLFHADYCHAIYFHTLSLIFIFAAFAASD